MKTSQLRIFLLHAWNDSLNDSTPNSVFLILADQREMKMVLMFHFFASLSYYNNLKITRMKTKIHLSLLPQCVLKQIKRLICSPNIASWNDLCSWEYKRKWNCLPLMRRHDLYLSSIPGSHQDGLFQLEMTFHYLNIAIRVIAGYCPTTIGFSSQSMMVTLFSTHKHYSLLMVIWPLMFFIDAELHYKGKISP